MSKTILEVKNLSKHYAHHGGFFGTAQSTVPAVDDVSFNLKENETMGLVGESGCGKTTTGKSIVKLVQPTSGNIIYDGTDITHITNREFRQYRSQIQMIFQDLDAALNPKMRIGDILAEAVKIHQKSLDKGQVRNRVYELLEMVNFKKNKLTSFPSELSGGEKRRVGLARVLAVEPKLIVADEPTSALDVSIQAQVVNLMRDLQTDLGLSYLFISHDLQLVELISHKIAVMYLGRIVELGASEAIIRNPRHPYTKILWSSLVHKDNAEAENVTDSGISWGVFDFAQNSQGCRFASRCPEYLNRGKPSECLLRAPELLETQSGEVHKVACHFPL
ncbi:MAG: ATP-binding cassette domain-containing protein [Gammaproteobacteria bacterium]|nr:ATP-binding cassette domain-containing protein [Gammaproteobacteria bacterium]MDH5800364.1 ATP-binding cassette domain-containing protein [Gammaproteobacteria bacterium]